MRKLNFILGLAAICVVPFFNSCSSDTNALGPSLELLSDAAVTTTPSSTITIEWRASAGDANLKTFTIAEGNSPITGWDEFEIPNAQNEAFESSAVVSIGAENTTFTLTVTDKDGLTSSETVTVTVEASADPINSYTAILMGGQDNLSIGSYLDADAGTVRLKAAAITNAATIDVVYYYGSTNHATLTAPDDATVNGGAGNLTLCTDFSVKNATRFGSSSVSSADFTAMTNDALLTGITGLSASKMTAVAEGNIIAFQTAAGKKGLIKVASITTGAGGTITLDVKVQQ
jgi:hypothetical protein